MLENLKCTTGAYVEIIPVGLQCTLQYNANGILQKIMVGFHSVNYADANVKVFSSDHTLQLMKMGMIPHRIPFSSGMTWIKVVFYTKKYFKRTGTLPYCIEDNLLEDLKINPENYKVYGCDISSDSFTFTGGPTISTRLATFGFESIPGYQVYDHIDRLPIERIMREKKSPFEFPYISGILTFDAGTSSTYIPADITQHLVIKTTEYIEEHGYLRSLIELDDTTIDVPYSDIVKYDISSKSIVLLNGENIIASRKPSSLFNNKLSRNKECLICHKKMIVPHSGHTHCSDSHCMSRMYPVVAHFLDTLGLSSLGFSKYYQLVADKKLTCLLDILYLDDYANKQIETTLSNLLFAIVPFEVCRGVDFFQQFTNYLGSVEAFDFYLENPDAIISDLHLNKMYATNFANWLKNPENLLMIRTLIDMKDQIHISPVRKQFSGAPIFRGKTICLTGKFKHGTLEDVISILQSYSARVTTNFDNTVNCVVIGHFECEDTKLTELATSYNIPIYGEDDFFTSYEIDKDLEKQKVTQEEDEE